jgi:Tfp pilus assembly protein PilN
MIGHRAGLYLRDERITVVVLSGRRTPMHCFAFEPEDVPGARLKSELESRQLKIRRLRIGLARPLVTVKTLELPPTRGAQLAEMVAFELERHVPFPSEDIRFDFVALPGKAKGPLRVLVAACERRTVEGALRLLEEPRLKPGAVTAACHELPYLLGHRPRTRHAVWAHRAGGATDLICLDQGRLQLSRTVPAKDADELAVEIGATLRLLDWQDCEAIWISGDDVPELLGASGLAELGIRVTEPPLKPGVRALVKQLPEEDAGAAMLALAVALGPPRPSLDLLPRELRPRGVTSGQLVTASTALLTVLLGLGILVGQGYKQHRYADRLAKTIRALDPEVKNVEGLAADLAQKKRLLETILSIERTNIRTLPVLKELTERIPQEAWLRTLNMEKQGIEITGQASAANQLIPLLESSPFLTSVEFTAPVTKAGDKEQFRIKAAWKNAPKVPAEPAAKAQSPPSPPGPRSGASRATQPAAPGR